MRGYALLLVVASRSGVLVVRVSLGASHVYLVLQYVWS
jgi:hypothetical protein